MRFLILVTCLFVGCASRDKESAQPQTLNTWVQAQEQISWMHLQKTISPEEPKTPGGPKPARGIVVAALHKKDPDYYFHWIRDSANVMRVVVERLDQPGQDPEQLRLLMDEFLILSRDLQRAASPYGMADPRFTVEGKVDSLKWSRPQYDGPALRALSAMRYLEFIERAQPAFTQRGNSKRLAVEVLRKDLDFLAGAWDRRGFDLWEELKAENYHTRLVQLAALERGAKRFKSKKYAQAAAQLEMKLNDHWDPTRNLLRSQLAIEATDGYSKKNSDVDSAVVVAVIESDRLSGGHSVLDDRVHSSIVVLENLFREIFPINQDQSLGLAYGRYRGDVYFGGNPWFLITHYYAQFYYRLGWVMAHGADFPVTPRNLEFVRALLDGEGPIATPKILKPGTPEHRALMAACVKKGDRILARVRAHVPADGQLYEQYDKKTGKPTSSRGIGWSHSTFIAAAREKARADAMLLGTAAH